MKSYKNNPNRWYRNITCRLILASGTLLPDSFAPRFNCSLSLTRVRKSERHFECLTIKQIWIYTIQSNK